jgi:hypothetical protein
MWLRRMGFLGGVTLVLAGYLSAQSPNGIINGLVLDPTGSTIPGAEIRIANDATGVQYTGKTNNEGIYVVANLPPGTYRLQVSKIGFKTLIKPDIILNVQDSLAINFTLPLGAASEVVTVTGGAPLVNTESGSVSTVIDRTFVENLPLNGRSFNTLLQLTPGAVIAPTTTFSPGQFSIAGQRTDANNFTVDGVSANFGVAVATVVGQSGTEERKRSAHLEERAASFLSTRCKSFASRRHRFLRNSGAPPGDKSFSQRAPERTNSTEGSSSTFATRLWMQTIGLPTTRESRAQPNITVILEVSWVGLFERTRHSSSCLTKELVSTFRTRRLSKSLPNTRGRLLLPGLLPT